MGYIGSLDNVLLVEIQATIDSLNNGGLDETTREAIYTSLPSMIEVCKDITDFAKLKLESGEELEGTINPFEIQRRLYLLNNRNPYKKS